MTDRYRGIITFGDIVAGDPAPTTPGLPKASIEEVIPGLRESHDGNFLVGVEKRQNESYMSRRPDSDALINQCRLQKGCNPRIDAWNEFVDTLKSSRLDLMGKVEAVNTWVNETIRFDDAKSDAGSDWRDWHQTPFTTLSSGKGQCTDIARLKYETLRASGALADTDMRLVDGLLYDEQGRILAGHEMLVVNVNEKDLVLNDNFTGTHWPSSRPLLHGGVESADVFVLGKQGGSAVNTYGRFVPQTADRENDTTYYPELRNVAAGNTLGIIQESIGNGRSEAVCTTDGNFCVDAASQPENAVAGTKAELQGVRHQIDRAHGLRP
jgi:predicted transglutaminase-like cysteine proteinase